ncbi:hypothetical protein BGX38DRAFT_1186884 [Terfezia claveryi]|nr:hypothetical protein BGX38DRAFT_1186884 [Terfezia claveryi]
MHVYFRSCVFFLLLWRRSELCFLIISQDHRAALSKIESFFILQKDTSAYWALLPGLAYQDGTAASCPEHVSC